jgi:SprT protein
MIEPVTQEQQHHIVQITRQYMHRAADHYGVDLEPIPVRFDIRGRAAGMYCVKRRERFIRFNPFLFAKYYEPNLHDTVPHEVAHYVTDMLFGLRNIRPHGDEWRSVMHLFGAEPKAVGDFDLEGIPVRRQRRFPYVCGCRRHALSASRHYRILRGQATYHCRCCGEQLRRPLGI